MGSSRIALAVVAVVALFTAAGFVAAAEASPRASSAPSLATCLKRVKQDVKVHGKLTVATSDPALSPWFVDNSPSNQQGYESGVAYDVAAALGFKVAQVSWYAEPYELSETSGKKPFDFDINEFIYDSKLTPKVSFSASYYNVNQSIVALRSDAIVTAHTPSELKSYLYGGLAGSPGLTFVTKDVKPTHAPVAYKTMADAIAALTAGKIDAIAVDVPTGQYLATEQLTDGVQVGQFKTDDEHYVLLLQKSSSITSCVNTAIKTLAKKGSFGKLSKKWLQIYNAIPVLKP